MEYGGDALPQGWARTTLSAVAEVVGGGTPSTKDDANFADGNISWVTPADLTGYTAKYIGQGARSLTAKGFAECGARMMPAGTVLFSSRAPIGYVAIASRPLCTNQGFKSFIPCAAVDSEYLYHYLKSAKDLATSLASGTTFLELSGAKAATIPLSLAPLAEQRRIVARIEELLSQVDAGVAGLRDVQKKLKRYRAAVLKAACEGTLVPTEAELAKQEYRSYEPASELLARVLAERRARWETDQLAKLRAAGKEPKDNKWKACYEEPAAPDNSTLPALPEGWTWTTLGQVIISGPQNGLYLPSSYYGQGAPILRIDDYQNGFSRSALELRRVRASPENLITYGLNVGDVVLNRVNSMTHIGKCLLIKERNTPALFESNMMRFKTAQAVAVDYVPYYLWSQEGRQRLIVNAKWAINQASINQQDVTQTAVPLPPLAEQERIVAEVELRLSVIDQMESALAANLKRAERLRQAILRDAFAGKLVPQDPTDEPADALLERIRTAREEAVAQARPTRKKETVNNGKSGRNDVAGEGVPRRQYQGKRNPENAVRVQSDLFSANGA